MFGVACSWVRGAKLFAELLLSMHSCILMRLSRMSNTCSVLVHFDRTVEKVRGMISLRHVSSARAVGISKSRMLCTKEYSSVTKHFPTGARTFG